MRGCRSQGGFSLIEILMAVAILGVGMTMVASVFPVAVDQSRQSVDETMAALSARSVAAVLRARRGKVLHWCRDPNNSTDETGPINLTTLLEAETNNPLPERLRCYNPQRFLYPPSDGQERSYQTGDLWRKGSYVPVVYATPINTLVENNHPQEAQAPSYAEGPWRITIVICKSRGEEPDALEQRWADNPAGAGGYIVHHAKFDFGHRRICRGEAHMISRLVGKGREALLYPASLPVRMGEGTSSINFYGATEQLWGYWNQTMPQSLHNWLCFPNAVAAYHTILGD